MNRQLETDEQDALDMLETLDDMSEDDIHRAKKSVQDRVDEAVKRVESLVEAKEAEILKGP